MGKGAKAVRAAINGQSRIDVEEMNRQRYITKMRTKARLNCIQRDIDFKKAQLECGKITETRVVHRMPDGSMSIVDGYVDGLKPKHILENEIDQQSVEIILMNEQLEEIEKIENENTKDNGSGSEGKTSD